MKKISMMVAIASVGLLQPGNVFGAAFQMVGPFLISKFRAQAEDMERALNSAELRPANVKTVRTRGHCYRIETQDGTVFTVSYEQACPQGVSSRQCGENFDITVKKFPPHSQKEAWMLLGSPHDEPKSLQNYPLAKRYLKRAQSLVKQVGNTEQDTCKKRS